MLDDNVPDICIVCGYIIGSQEQGPDYCDKCRGKGYETLLTNTIAERDELRDRCLRLQREVEQYKETPCG